MISKIVRNFVRAIWDLMLGVPLPPPPPPFLPTGGFGPWWVPRSGRRGRGCGGGVLGGWGVFMYMIFVPSLPFGLKDLS